MNLRLIYDRLSFFSTFICSSCFLVLNAKKISRNSNSIGTVVDTFDGKTYSVV